MSFVKYSVVSLSPQKRGPSLRVRAGVSARATKELFYIAEPTMKETGNTVLI